MNQSPTRKVLGVKTPDSRSIFGSIWAITAAFGAYFCMYGFRKPFTASTYEDAEVVGVAFKTVLVTSQVMGYTLSKFVGIKVISEMSASRRPLGILILIALAELSLALFGLTPRPWNGVWLFFNGLSLGMVFGLVMGFLEGRRTTEAWTAGLCASFILADGATKSVGTWLLVQGCSEDWMPAVAGLLFLSPLVLFVGMLSKIPQPTRGDEQARTARYPMTPLERRELFGQYGIGLSLIVLFYLLITILRSIRADFAPELWKGLGTVAVPSLFTQSEIVVALGILLVNGMLVFVIDNKRAFFLSLLVCVSGLALLVLALTGLHFASLSGFSFMVLLGLGLYLPYVAVHTTVFERFLAMTRSRGNIGFLMYLADSIGYLGYAGIMLARNFWRGPENFLAFFLPMCWTVSIAAIVLLTLTWLYFAFPRPIAIPNPSTAGEA